MIALLIAVGLAFLFEFLRCLRQIWKEDHMTNAEIINYWENLRWKHKEEN